MVDNKDKNGAPGDFDEDFDVEDFSESDFDEAAFDDSEVADLPDDEFGDEDFAEDDWQEEKGNNKKLLTSGEKKGLSFNTMVMIGAFILGAGFLAFNVMKQPAQPASAEGSIFQSMLDISGVMDGDLFGEKEPEKTPEELAAQAEQTQNEGFLNNPDAAIPPDTAANPPQPTPIAPPEEAATDNQPLTPMPENATPRGPEEGTPESQVAISETPVEQTPATDAAATPSAEDILKQAMVNREQKAADQPAALPIETPVEEAAAPPEATPEPSPAPDAAEEPAQTAETAQTPPEAQPATPEAQPAPAETVPVAQAPAAAAPDTKALEKLDGRLEDVVKRMEQIETDLGSVKNSKQADTQNLQDTIESLKAEIAELKNRPAAAPVSQRASKSPREEVEEPAADEPVEEAPRKKAPRKVAKAKPAVAKAAPAAASGRWELRAAQPGRAWVSKPGERDMQSVEIGQTIAGVGRVTGILYQNGRWTVQGTQGQINQ